MELLVADRADGLVEGPYLAEGIVQLDRTDLDDFKGMIRAPVVNLLMK